MMAISTKAWSQNADLKGVQERLEQGEAMRTLVKEASHTIAPLWPIATFAARSPWLGLEEQTFDQTAQWMQEMKEVSLYPQTAMIRAAEQRGDIEQHHLEEALNRFLQEQPPSFALEEAKRFALKALQMEPVPAELMGEDEVKRTAEAMGELKLPKRLGRKSMLPLSVQAERQGLGPKSSILDKEMIQWCKLYLDQTQSIWQLPGREEGLYAACKGLIHAGGGVSNSRNTEIPWPDTAVEALATAMDGLQIAPQRRRE